MLLYKNSNGAVMDLLQLFLAYWPLIVLLWIVAGYQIGKLSLEVYDKWVHPEDDTLGTWTGLRLLLFPINSLNKIWVRKEDWFLVDSPKRGAYLFYNMFTGPTRVLVWTPFMLVSFFIIMPFISLIVCLLWRVIRDSIRVLINLFTNQTPVPVPLPNTESSQTQ